MWIPFSPEPFGFNGCKIRQVCQAWFSVHVQTLSLAWRVRTFVPGLSGRCPQEFGLALPCIRTPACCPARWQPFVGPMSKSGGSHLGPQNVVRTLSLRCPDVVRGPCPGLGGSHLGPRTSSRRCPCGMFCSSFLYRRSID